MQNKQEHIIGILLISKTFNIKNKQKQIKPIIDRNSSYICIISKHNPKVTRIYAESYKKSIV